MGEDIHNARVFASVGDDEICIVYVIADILFIHRFDRIQILAVNALHASTTVSNIPLDTAQETDVWIDLNKDLKVQHVPNVWIVKDMDSLEQNHVCGLNSGF